MTQKKKVLVFTTGGTIDKSYVEEEGSLDNREPLLFRLLQKLRLPHLEVEVVPLLAKDSLYMTSDDRAYIAKHLGEAMKKNLPIVVVHGTDTMVETAKVCHSGIPTPDVPIVFTGAMKPIGYEDSDAFQNFVEALTASQLLAPGIYLSFHGHIFNVPNVVKNKTLRTFEKP